MISEIKHFLVLKSPCTSVMMCNNSVENFNKKKTKFERMINVEMYACLNLKLLLE